MTTIYFFIFIIGLCIGSFLNVIILRTFSGESIVFPPSKCPKCQTPLKWWHNIPVLSYIFLKGKCAFCKEKISIQYPIVELITGFGFVALFWKFGLSLNTLAWFIMFSLFVVISATDIKEKVAFDVHTISLIVVGLIYGISGISGINQGEIVILKHAISLTVLSSILGAILGFLVMEIVARFGLIIAGTRAFGEADSYIMSALGAIFGINNIFLIFIYAFVITVPVYLIKIFKKKNYTTFIGLILFFLLYFAGKFFELQYVLGLKMYYIYAIFLTTIGFWICLKIIRDLKKANVGEIEDNIKNDLLTYLPFGPSLLIGAIIFVFLNM